MLSSWFDKLTTIGFFPNVLSKVEGQAQGERFFAFCQGRKEFGLQCLFNDGPIISFDSVPLPFQLLRGSFLEPQLTAWGAVHLFHLFNPVAKPTLLESNPNIQACLRILQLFY